MRTFFYLLFSIAVVLPAKISVQAQSSFHTIQGKVIDENGVPIPFVSVGIRGSQRGAVTTDDGNYSITKLKAGNYTLVTSSIGYQSSIKEVEVKAGSTVTVVNFTLEEKILNLANLHVSAESEAARRSKEPVTISAIDAVSLNTQAIGAEGVLKRTTGVLVRQQGGLGSQSSINLNGLTGNAVRIYYDGIPLELYGGGIQMNNLPVNSIERIEVYKGVMPITIGTDALGGGINIIPKTFGYDFVQASYEYGSYNTQRATVAGRKKLNQSWALSGNLFVNRSQNDYEMENTPNQTVRIFENEFGRTDTAIVENTIDAERFNNEHVSAYIEGKLTVSDKSWADELTFSSAYSFRHDEYQHAQRVTKRPAGEAYNEMESFIQRIKYNQSFGDNLWLSYFGMLSLTEDIVDDSTSHVYDWNGDILPITNNRGSEILGSPSLREGQHTGTAHRLTFSYTMHPRHTLAFSNFYGYSRIEGNDPVGNRLDLNGELLDPNTIPSHFHRNIAGLELKSTWLDEEKISTTLFYKNYFYKARSIDITQQQGDIIPRRNNESNDHGFGVAAKWDILSNLFVRSSFERTIRIPDETEIYGNFISIIPNYTIRPERSNNLNLGTFYRKTFAGSRFYSVDLNLFLRQQRDLIRLEPQSYGEQSKYINEEEVSAKGIELALKSSPLQNLSAQANITYQKIALSSSDEVQDDSFVGVQVPNLPDFFLNTSLTYQFNELFNTQDFLELYWNYYFVDQFSVTYVLDESRANPVNIVPAQHQHNAGVTYSPGAQPLSLSFQVNNLLNQTLYDNFRVPKPGFNFSFKINYSFNHY